jgi:serine/threonine protein phosphatase 1
MKVDLDLTAKNNLYFVGDVHGQWNALKFGIEQLGIHAQDALISVGDVIDRGEDSVQCLNFFLDTPNKYMVRGNHEDMFINGHVFNDRNAFACQMWNGGEWVDQYPIDYVYALAYKCKKLPYYLTVKHGNTLFGVVHAECPTNSWLDMSADIKEGDDRLWGRNKVLNPNVKDTIVDMVDFTIHGHTPDKDVRIIGNQYFIDTGGQVMDSVHGLTFLCWDGAKFSTYKVVKEGTGFDLV